MKDVLIIIPLHVIGGNTSELLKRAIKSVPNGFKIRLSTTEDINEKYINEILEIVDKDKSESFSIVTSPNDKSDFCSLVNNAVDKEYKWFSILEFDDEYTDIWFKNVEKEMPYHNDVSVFMPLEELIDFDSNRFVGYGNEAPWASAFSNDIGFIDNDCIQEFFDFYLTGCLFNTQDWINCGGLKSSIKVTFWYEFMLRLTSKNKKFYVIPKLGYKHYVNREGSLYYIYKKTISQEESKWWYELAKEECNFKQDRNKTYNSEVAE